MDGASVSRKEAKVQGRKRYFTGRPCKWGHITERKVSDGKCIACQQEWQSANQDYFARWYQENRSQVSVYGARRYAQNRQKILAQVKARYNADPTRASLHVAVWRANNPDKVRAARDRYQSRNATRILARVAAWQKANPDRVRANKKRYQKANPEKLRADVALRRAKEHRATPAWALLSDILPFYREATRLSNETGIIHHVDHIVPLRSRWVCGLHVACNLQVVPATANCSKSNYHWPDMGQLSELARRRRIIISG